MKTLLSLIFLGLLSGCAADGGFVTEHKCVDVQLGKGGSLARSGMVNMGGQRNIMVEGPARYRSYVKDCGLPPAMNISDDGELTVETEDQ